MPSLWIDILDAQPTDGQLVWFRRTYFSNAKQATFDAATQTFTTGNSTLAGSGFGNPNYNTTFTLAPTLHNGQPYWTTTTGHFLFYDAPENLWLLSGALDDDSSVADYQNPTTSHFAPWYDPNNNSQPGTIATNALVLPWYMVSRWRPA